MTDDYCDWNAHETVEALNAWMRGDPLETVPAAISGLFWLKHSTCTGDVTLIAVNAVVTCLEAWFKNDENDLPESLIHRLRNALQSVTIIPEFGLAHLIRQDLNAQPEAIEALNMLVARVGFYRNKLELMKEKR